MDRALESFNVALGAIWLNRGRAVLTMLGIIIGIAAVVALVSLGRGVEQYVVGEFVDLGSDVLTVSSAMPESERRSRIEPLTLDTVTLLAAQPSIREAGADFNVNGLLAVANGESVVAMAKGITPNVIDLQSWELAAGAAINDEHLREQRRVAVIGSEVAVHLFPDSEPAAIIGRSLRYDAQVFDIIGVLEPAGIGVGDTDNAVLVPLTTAQERLTDARTGGSARVTTIYVAAFDSDSADAAEMDIHRTLQALHGIATPDERDYRVNSQGGLLDTITEVTAILTVFLAAIASISLLVGGIGIMNIMLVTVTERTREIGLRKAVGAEPFDILAQFLFESLLLAVLGGLLGIIVAALMTALTSALIPDLTVSVQADAVLLATIIASLIGIVFGLLPAQQAANLNPIDALRYE